ACRITQQPLDQLREIVGRRLRAVAASPCALVRAAVEAGCGALALANVLVDHAIAELDTVGDHLINGAGVAGALRVLSRRTLLGVGCVRRAIEVGPVAQRPAALGVLAMLARATGGGRFRSLHG